MTSVCYLVLIALPGSALVIIWLLSGDYCLCVLPLSFASLMSMFHFDMSETHQAALERNINSVSIYIKLFVFFCMVNTAESVLLSPAKGRGWGLAVIIETRYSH